MRAIENFDIGRVRLHFYPELIRALAMVKEAAARANGDLGLLDGPTARAIVDACREIEQGRLHEHFVVDMVQGGAGTSTNMNANEVIANRALELLGHERGEYGYCHPNNHVNRSQSTNDAYPTAVRIALIFSLQKLVETLRWLVDAFRAKGAEFAHVIKMGRTQLQDAVPMTLGQEFEAYAANLSEEIDRIEQNYRLFLEVNMGATAIGTGINADPDYSPLCIRYLREITGLPVVAATNLIEATNDTGAFIMNSSALKRLATKMSKICNDLRLLSSGPRSRQSGGFQGNRKRSDDYDRLRGRPVGTERHGADHRIQPVREHRDADPQHEHAARPVRHGHHGQRGDLSSDGAQQYRSGDGSQSLSGLRNLDRAGQDSAPHRQGHIRFGARAGVDEPRGARQRAFAREHAQAAQARATVGRATKTARKAVLQAAFRVFSEDGFRL